MNKILITGGCGFIGANLAAYLISKDYSLTVLDNMSRGRKSYLAPVNFKFIEGDVRNRDDVLKATQDVDCVIHLAAYGSVIDSINEPHINFDHNVVGTFTLLEACIKNGVSKFIFASTGGALIGNAPPPVSETSLPKPISPYGASKLCGEGYCGAFANSYNLDVVILRFANIYGPISAHKAGVITVFCKALLRNEPFVIYGDGSASRDFLYVGDLCKGIGAAISKPLPRGTVLHLASDVETTIISVAQSLIQIAGKEDHKIVYRSARKGEVLRNFATYQLAQELIGFHPTVTLQKGLEATWNWFFENGKNGQGLTNAG